MTEEVKAVEKEVNEGAFISSLKRNNTKIKADRAEAIGEDAQLIYKRQIEDLKVAIKRMKREQENMLDLSPTSAINLTLASDFDAPVYVSKDIELSVKIRNESIKLDLARERYIYLFGEEI